MKMYVVTRAGTIQLSSPTIHITIRVMRYDTLFTQREGSNDGPQNMFLCKNTNNYPKIIPVTPSYLEHCHG